MMTFRDVVSKRVKRLWKNKMMLKLKYLTFKNKLQIWVALKNKKKYKNYILCGVPENVDHVFFHFPVCRGQIHWGQL